MADGKIVIETGLDTDGIKKDLNQAEKQINSSTKKMKVTFEELSKQSGKSVEELKTKAKSLAEEYQKQGMNLPNAYKKAYNEMGVYSENAAKKMQASVEKVEEASEKSADKTSEKWDKSLKKTQQDSESAKKKIKEDAEKEKQAHERASERSKEAWSKAFGTIKSLAGAAVKTTAVAITGVSAALMGAGAYAVKTGIDFESAFAGVKKTVDASETQLGNLRQSLIDMSKAMPQSASELAEIAEAAGQLGIQTENLEAFTKTMAQLGDATNMASTEAADCLARFANITGMSQTNFDRLGSTIVALGNNLATTESEITAMGMRLAGAGHQVGMTEAQIMSFSAALSSVGIEAEAGGSAFSTVMSNMQLACENGGDSLNDFASVAGMSASEFKKAFEKDAASAIIAFIKGLSNCESQGKSAIGVLSDMGITEIRQRDALLRAASASDVFTKALDIGTQAWEDNTALANEATQRYDTLKSKLSMAKNSVDALAIAFKDSVNDELRGAVEQGTVYIDQLSQAFANGGLEAAVDKAGDIVANLATRIAQSAPNMINASTNLIQSFVEGISKNKVRLRVAAEDIVDALCDGLIKLLPKKMQEPTQKALDSLKKTFKTSTKNLLSIGQTTIGALAKIFVKLADNMDTALPVVISLVSGFKTFKAVSGPVGAVVTTVAKLNTTLSGTGTAMAALKTAIAAMGGPVTLLITGVAAVGAALAAYAITTRESTDWSNGLSDAEQRLIARIHEQAEAYQELKAEREKQFESINAEFSHTQALAGELSTIVDENGKIKKGYEDRAAVIVGLLNDALGTEIEITDGVIQKYDELKDSIDEVILKKKAEAVQNAMQDSYAEAINNETQAQLDCIEARKDLEKTTRNLEQAQKDYAEAQKNANSLYDNTKVEEAAEKVRQLEQAQRDQVVALTEYEDTYMGYVSTIENYGRLVTASTSGSANEINEATLKATNSFITAEKATEGSLARQLFNMKEQYNAQKEAIAAGAPGVTQEAVDNAALMVAAATAEYAKLSSNASSEFAKLDPAITETLAKAGLEGKLSDEGKRVLNSFVESLDGMDADTREKFEDAAKGALQGVARFDEVVAKAEEEGISFLEALAETLEVHSPSRAVKEIFAQVNPGAVEGLNEGKDGLLEKGKGIMSEFLGSLSQGVVDGTPAVISTVNQGITSAANAGVQAAQVEKERLAAAGAEMQSAVPEGAATVDTITVPSQKSQEAVNSAISAIILGASGLNQAAQASAANINTGYQSADVTSGPTQAGNTSVQALVNAMSGMNGSVLQATASIALAATSALKNVNLSNNFQTQAKTAVSQFCAAIRSQTSAAVNATKALGTGVAKALVACNLNTSAQTQGRSFGSSFASGIRGQSTPAESAARAIGNAAKNALSGFGNTGSSIGVQFSSGLANGIRSGQNGVAAAAAAVAAAAANAAKANLDIHSPSRVGGYIGRMFDKGIELDVKKGAAGIKKAVNSVTDSMKINPSELLESMRGAFDSAVNRITNNQASLRMLPITSSQQEQKAGDIHQTINFYQETKSPVETSRAIRKEARRLAFTT